MSFLKEVIADFKPHHTDAFSRLRVTQPQTLWEDKLLYTAEDHKWNTVVSGGGSVNYVSAESLMSLGVGTASGDFAIRQTKRYFSYIAGKSHLISMTGVLGAGQSGTVRRVGYFDDNNGLFFELNGTTLRVVKRSNHTGSIVDTAVAQADWNVDKLDGTGPSGLTLDVSQAQIFVIDFQWLGVGRVRFGFNIEGTTYTCHELSHFNNITSPYIATPNLPVRYEIRNTSAVAASATLRQICSTVVSEGGFTPPALSFSVGNQATVVNVSATRKAIVALRLAPTLNSKPNRRTIYPKSLSLYTDGNVFWEFSHIITPTFSGGTWVSANTLSGAEYNVGLASLSGTESIIDSGYLTAAGAGSVARAEKTINLLDLINVNQRIVNNYDASISEFLVVFARTFTSTANVAAMIGFSEFD